MQDLSVIVSLVGRTLIYLMLLYSSFLKFVCVCVFSRYPFPIPVQHVCTACWSSCTAVCWRRVLVWSPWNSLFWPTVFVCHALSPSLVQSHLCGLMSVMQKEGIAEDLFFVHYWDHYWVHYWDANILPSVIASLLKVSRWSCSVCTLWPFRAARCRRASPVGSQRGWHWWTGARLPRTGSGMSSQRCLFVSRFVSFHSWRLEQSSSFLKATVIFCSSTMPSSSQLGVSITSAPIITASAASFLKTWRPCLQVLTAIFLTINTNAIFWQELFSFFLLFQEAKKVLKQTKAGTKLAVFSANLSRKTYVLHQGH